MLFPVLGLSLQERPGAAGASPVESSEDDKHLCYEEMLRELGVFSFGEEMAERGPHQCM